MTAREVPFRDFLTPNRRPYTLGPTEDANLLGMRLYGGGPFHRELKPASKIRKKSHFLVRAGDVIYNKLFAWRGTFGIVPDEMDGMFVSDKFPTYRLDHSQVDANYLRLYFQCRELWEQARRMSTGSAALSKLTLNPPRFLELTAPLPSMAAQRRIAERLASLEIDVRQLVSLREGALGNTEALFVSMLDSMMTNAKARFPVRALRGLVDQGRGISYGVVQTGRPHPMGVPTLRAGDLRRFEVLLTNVKRVDPTIEARYARTRLQGGEVLLRIRGGLGEVAVCPDSMIGGNVSREIAVIPVDGSLLPEFLMYMIAAPSSQDFLTRHLRGTSYVGINLKDVRRLEVPVPPEREQRLLLSSVSRLRRTIEMTRASQAASKSKIGALMPSALRSAYFGSRQTTS